MPMKLYRKMIVEGCELQNRPGFPAAYTRMAQLLFKERYKPVCVDCSGAAELLAAKHLTGGDILSQPAPPPFPLFWLEWDISPLIIGEAAERQQSRGDVPVLQGALVATAPDFVPGNTQLQALSVEGALNRSGAVAGRMTAGWTIETTTGVPVLGPDSNPYYAAWQDNISEEWTGSWVLLTASLLWFLSVRNIVQAPININPKEQRQLRGHGAKRLDYRILKISSTLTRGQANQSTGGHRDLPLHLIIGHFRRYSDEKPLFGKYAGTFFIPAHTRGKEENGVINKGYCL